MSAAGEAKDRAPAAALVGRWNRATSQSSSSRSTARLTSRPAWRASWRTWGHFVPIWWWSIVGPPDGTAAIVSGFPEVRLIRCANRGFAYANNRGLMTCDARYVLFLNPDTEILDGDFAISSRGWMSGPSVGLVGARQIDGEGRLDLTIRRFPNALRALGDALSVERVPRPAALAGRARARS